MRENRLGGAVKVLIKNNDLKRDLITEYKVLKDKE